MHWPIYRFIIHLIIDVQTKLVMGMSLSLDNNSVVGAQRALMNLAESKVEFCQKYGITITDDLWPSSGCRVQSLRVDRGAEYMSKEFERICNENGITLTPTPARTASRKGTVEQQFHIFDSMWKDLLSEYGTISKLHGSNHHAKASLDYFAVMKILINCIIRHNMSEIPNFKRSKEMIEKRISTSPINLWKYYSKKYHTVLPIGNISSFLYSLMTPTKCYISRNGVRWEGLWYSYKDQKIDEIRWKGNSVSMDVRMDRRDVSRLYYLHDGKLHIMTLSFDKTYNMDFMDMPYEMYMKYREIQKSLEAKAKEQNIRIDTINRLLVKEILGSNKRDTYANITQMSLNRTVEKNLIKSADNMYKQIQSISNKPAAESKKISAEPQKITNDDDWTSRWKSVTDEMQDSERNFIKD